MSGPSKQSGPLLEVGGLSKIFRVRQGLKTQSLRAVTDMSFALARGEVLALVGESGCGKSTVARLITRLVRPTSGTIRFGGEDALASRRVGLSYRSRVQMIFQDPFGSLNPVHTVGYCLARPMLRHGKVGSKDEARRRVDELLETVGLGGGEFARVHPHQMSGGQRQRVSIARALAVDPELILADEPTSMLDVSIRVDILNLLRDLKRDRGISYLYITHDLASARYFADRTLVMYAGYAVESAPSHALMDEPAHPYTRLLLSAVPDARGSFSGELAAKSGAPDQLAPPAGCPFAERCPDTVDRCYKELPAYREFAHGRHARCHLID